jgi:hypothetical protein
MAEPAVDLFVNVVVVVDADVVAVVCLDAYKHTTTTATTAMTRSTTMSTFTTTST